MVELIIDGQKVKAEKGSYLIEAAKKIGIKIPSLCYHKALDSYGACRLCIVEITGKKGSRIVTACNYPVKESIEVRTGSERALKERKVIIELLLARCPNVEAVRNLADEMGIKEPRFKVEDQDCILCGLCERVCDEIIGVSAISFVNRGTDVKVGTPFHIVSEACIGCGACAAVCPTGTIKIEDGEKTREIKYWHTALPLGRCNVCGKPVAPEAQIKYLSEKINISKEFFETCQECKREHYKERIITTRCT